MSEPRSFAPLWREEPPVSQAQQETTRLHARHSARGAKINLSPDEVLRLSDDNILRVIEESRKRYAVHLATSKGIKSKHPLLIPLAFLFILGAMSASFLGLSDSVGRYSEILVATGALTSGIGIGAIADVLRTRHVRRRRSEFAQALIEPSHPSVELGDQLRVSDGRSHKP